MIRWVAVLALWAGAANGSPIADAWRNWVAHVGATESTLVTIIDGETAIVSLGIDPMMPVPVASLSKAITASCLRAVLRQHPNLNLDSPLSDILTVPGQHPATTEIPLRAFVQHASGLDRDSTQADVLTWITGNLPATPETVAAALARTPGPEGSFFYNNENYEVITAVIEALTGQDYFTACQDRVFVPIGVTSAGPDGQWGALAGAGGLAITAQDYATFFVHHAAAQGADLTDVGGGAFYGDGVFVRPTQNGRNIWHYGAVCLRGFRDSGAFAVVMDGGQAMVVTYNACPNQEQALALQTALIPILVTD